MFQLLINFSVHGQTTNGDGESTVLGPGCRLIVHLSVHKKKGWMARFTLTFVQV